MRAISKTNNKPIPPSELIITDQGRIYHLDLLPEDIADTIILVGDQERVPLVSNHFDSIELKRSKREFITHTGTLNNKRVSVISTGIGCDNIDIVINELDALVNIDFKTRLTKTETKALNLIRIGSTGALQKEIEVDSFVVSSHGLGFDGLMSFYNPLYNKEEIELKEAFLKQTSWPVSTNQPYFIKGNDQLIEKIGKDIIKGITATANGFYGPQGRMLRLIPKMPMLNEQLNKFSYKEHKIINFEMETSALYGLSSLLGHNSCTICAVIANRFSNTFSKDYKKPIEKLIYIVLQRVCF